MHETVISHVRQADNAIQSNADHCNGVAIMAQDFARAFSMGPWGFVLGQLHDLGKERNSFQKYIRQVTGLEPTNYHGEDKRHAYIGAIVANKLYAQGNPLLPFAISGHHSGLKDYTDLKQTLLDSLPDEVVIPQAKEKLTLVPDMVSALQQFNTRDGKNKGINHIGRMLYSCLVDADYLDTERFMSPVEFDLRQSHKSLQELKPLLDDYLVKLKDKSIDSPINQLRQKIQAECIRSARGSKNNGCYSLTVPTGAGKTLSSLAWAIEHSLRHGKHRIIIAIPYTSIVTQTAQILSEIFGKENVLEHHSCITNTEIGNPDLRLKMKLATENWDYPIIVTTNVQLIESMMGSKPSKCRKLHNIANSVVILDELQTLPINQLQPILDALVVYQKLFNTTMLLTTASMPAIADKVEWESAKANHIDGIPNIIEIIPSEWNLPQKFKRCSVAFLSNRMTHKELAAHMEKHNRVLCIVNTRKDAKKVYANLSQQGHILHLSRMMCSAHIKEKLAEIKTLLRSELAEPIRVVSTQLVEAGVDIDFPVVYRQESGLDSIVQAAGRCNREGKLTAGQTFVFKFEKPPFGAIGKACDACNTLASVNNWFLPQTMYDYFIQRYIREDIFDENNISDLLYKPSEMCYETADKKFNMISDNTTTVYVNYGDSPRLIARLKAQGPSNSLMRELSQYSVGIYRADFETLLSKGLIEEIIDGLYWVSEPAQYSADLGLVVESHWLEETLIL